ncbi:hypothetical protein MVEN_00835300 [Mycena venus]|uniref:F-box domain-containing protein n=1 Tax=Mycena venus TaxID=2733690 RepID=A0A8H6YGJ1_9AGAR|nr:hypothetical protein MVEN_00835300 [Mycena venus]
MMSSPFASQLGTNYCPRDDELSQIKGLLNEPCLKLKSLDDEIAAMRKVLDKLTEERDALSAYVEAHEALLAPIRRLPLDILEHIFVACLPTHRNCVMSAQEAPVILGRICSLWRKISLSTPRLWCRLHIVEPTDPETSNQSNASRRLLRLEAARSWLRRSGECPLSISLESNYNSRISLPVGASFSPAKPDLFLTALIPLAARWQKIRFATPHSTLKALLCLTENDVPLLKHLEIVCFEPGDPHDTSDAGWSLAQATYYTTSGSPDLRELRLSGHETPHNSPTATSLVSSLAASPRLEIIKINSDTFTKSSLTDFLRGLPPTVQHLQITEPTHPAWHPYAGNTALDDDVLTTLATYCSTLKELIIRNCCKVSDEGLLCFIIYKNPALKRIEVEFGRVRQVDIRPNLQLFATDGLETSITYKNTLPPARFSPWQGLPDAPLHSQWDPWSASD